MIGEPEATQTATVPDPCTQSDAGCASIGPAPAEEFLRQALGSNYGDVRLPSLLLVSAALIAFVARTLKRRFRRTIDE